MRSAMLTARVPRLAGITLKSEEQLLFPRDWFVCLYFTWLAYCIFTQDAGITKSPQGKGSGAWGAPLWLWYKPSSLKAAVRSSSTNGEIEHTQRLLTKSPEVTSNTIQHYKMLLRVIFDNEPLIPQTSQDIMSRRPITTLTPNFLCLQCPTTCTIRERSLHGQMRAHMFCKGEQCLGYNIC